MFGKKKHIVGYLTDFLFSAKRAMTRVAALSGGERNRVLLAKLFTRPTNLLVLDEPRAAMDASAEAEVFEHFRNSSSNKMTILISHRFSTVRAAAQIVVIHQGEILERGTHESLLAMDGQYAHLFNLQAQGYK